jgi:hypothetical protein
VRLRRSDHPDPQPALSQTKLTSGESLLTIECDERTAYVLIAVNGWAAAVPRERGEALAQAHAEAMRRRQREQPEQPAATSPGPAAKSHARPAKTPMDVPVGRRPYQPMPSPRAPMP